MADDSGLLFGLTEGLRSGMKSYRDESDRLEKYKEKEEERKGKLAARKNQGLLFRLNAEKSGYKPKYADSSESVPIDEREVLGFDFDETSPAAEKLRSESAYKDAMMQQILGKEKFETMKADLANREHKLKMAKEGITEDYQLNDQEKAAKDAKIGLIKAQTTKAGKLPVKGGQGGGKMLPAGVAQSLAGANTAVSNLMGLKDAFKQNSGNVGLIKGRLGQLGGAMGMNTDAAVLQSQIDANIQAIGTFLEDGKLTDPDFMKYKRIGPSATDQPEVAEQKMQRLADMVALKQENEMKALKGSGYNVSGITGAKGLISSGKDPKDPQAEKYAQMHGLDYAKAKAILDKRRAGK